MKAVEVEKMLKDCDKCTSVALRQWELAKLYLHFQKWQSALDVYSASVTGCEFIEFEGLFLGDAYSEMAYCHFKLGELKLAEKYFSKANSKIDEFKEVGHLEWLLKKSKVAGYELQFEFVGRKKPQTAEKFCQLSTRLLKTFQETRKSFVKKSFMAACYEPKAYFQLGFYYEFVKKQYSQAIEHYGESCKSATATFSNIHPYHCDCSLAIARCYFKLSKTKEGVEKLEYAFKHACALFDLNDVYFEAFFELFHANVDQQKSVKKASSVFGATMKILCDQNFSQSYFAANFAFNFANRLYDEGFTVTGGAAIRCVDLFEKSLEVFQNVFGSKDKRSGQCERMLGLCSLKNGDVTKAEWHLLNSAIILSQN